MSVLKGKQLLTNIGILGAIALSIILVGKIKPQDRPAIAETAPNVQPIIDQEELPNNPLQKNPPLRMGISVDHTSFLKVQLNDEIKMGDVISDNSNERQRLDLQKKSIKLEKDTCKEMYSDKMDEIEHVDEIYYSVKKKLYENSKLSIHKLITELETGGNIRLEEGKSNEKWYVSCVDLIRSRFHNEDMSLMGI